MALTERLQADAARRFTNRQGCGVCRWIDSLPSEDVAAINAWIEAGHSKAQLHQHCVAEGLTSGLSSFVVCMRRDRGHAAS